MNTKYMPQEIVDSKYSWKVIFKYIPQEYAWSLILGYWPELNQKYHSPFREDKTPGCFFSWRNGKLIFCDYAASKSFDVFNAASILLRMDMRKFLGFILDSYDFFKEYKSSSIYENTQGARSQLFIETRDFYSRDAKFWSQYAISSKNLEEDSVYAVKNIVLRKNDINKEIKPKIHSYAYCEFDHSRKKIYQPYDKKLKWLSNVSKNDIGGVKTLQVRASLNNTLIIAKSYKDYRVIKNCSYPVVWFQNEGMVPDQEYLNFFKSFRSIVIFFDNDEPGKAASLKVRDELEAIFPKKNFFIRRLRKDKDPSDMVKRTSLANLNRFLKNMI